MGYKQVSSFNEIVFKNYSNIWQTLHRQWKFFESFAASFGKPLARSEVTDELTSVQPPCIPSAVFVSPSRSVLEQEARLHTGELLSSQFCSAAA